jgi:hypothetical protein
MERVRDAAAHAAIAAAGLTTVAWVGFLGWATWHFMIG